VLEINTPSMLILYWKRLGVDKGFSGVYNKVVMARYDALRKLDRNKMLREYAGLHPELSLKEIGQRFNISGSRVWRILHAPELYQGHGDKSFYPEG